MDHPLNMLPADESETIYIDVALDIESDDDIDTIEAAVKSTIQGLESRLSLWMERLIDIADARQTVSSGSFTVDAIDWLEDGAAVASVSFFSSFHAGCRDQNSTDHHEDQLNFEVDNNRLFMKVEVPSPWRSDL